MGPIGDTGTIVVMAPKPRKIYVEDEVWKKWRLDALKLGVTVSELVRQRVDIVSYRNVRVEGGPFTVRTDPPTRTVKDLKDEGAPLMSTEHPLYQDKFVPKVETVATFPISEPTGKDQYACIKSSATVAQAKAEIAKQREDGPSVKPPEVKPLTKSVPPIEGVKKAGDLPPMPKLDKYRPGPVPKKGGK